MQFPYISICFISTNSNATRALLENILIHTECLTKIEILIGVDQYQQKLMAELQADLASIQQSIIHLCPLHNNQFSLVSNDFLQKFTHPKSYFVWPIDENVRIATVGWEKTVEKFIGYFPDGMMTLKVSDNCLRNYFDLRDALEYPEYYPIFTKTWLQHVGDFSLPLPLNIITQGIHYYLGLAMANQAYVSFRSLPILQMKIIHTPVRSQHISKVVYDELRLPFARLAAKIWLSIMLHQADIHDYELIDKENILYAKIFTDSHEPVDKYHVSYQQLLQEDAALGRNDLPS